MKWFITGGAGFIGCNVAASLLSQGHSVVAFDNLSRRGAVDNLKWLDSRGDLRVIRGDIRHFDDLATAIRAAAPQVVLHLAAQVAVTSSVVNPRHDFDVNAAGGFNVCDAIRQFAPTAILLNASTNKVYGSMSSVAISPRHGRYEYRDLPDGVPEVHPLAFHSPYGCSKGCADQYVQDFSAIYGLRTVTFRQSCIYGPRQFGIEDQGWVAWFAIAATLGTPITIYGDGMQVRDILYVDDLVNCYLKAISHIDVATGQAYNIGGGPHLSASVLEVLQFLEAALGRKIEWATADWRPGDQRVFISDIAKAKRDLGWEPLVSKEEGLRKLLDWVLDNRELLQANA
jgi:CDP-paratose 2-epimerase